MSCPLSVLIVARNESDNIVDCIQSVSFADEVIVIDDMSEDNTLELAQAQGARVFQRAMNGNWGEQQNFAIEKATNNWLLFLDADERITSELAIEIQESVSQNKQYTFSIHRLNFFHKKRVCFGALRPDFVERLMPKQGVSIHGRVHQKMVHPYKVKKLKHGMLHYTYDSLEQYYSKLNRYSELSAQKYLEEGKTVSFFRDIILRPIWAFLKVYIIHLGFLDGKIGWVLAMGHYNYTMTKYARFYYLKYPF